MNNIKKLEKLINQYPLELYSLHSRVHPLPSLSNLNQTVFLKRDDELSCSISGSKMRKYASLLPYLKSEQFQQCLLIGGAYSNNILGLSQLLIENRIKPILFLRKPGNPKISGNLQLIKILVDERDIHWISRAEWGNVNAQAVDFLVESNSLGLKSIVIPEGAFIDAALPGAMTLYLDILLNEVENNRVFDHLFIDAGTGLQAIALILAHSWLKSSSEIHVVLIAPKHEEFVESLYCLKKTFESLFNEKLTEISRYHLYTPKNAPSFGSVNRTLTDYIKLFAKTEGVFLDPIYSGKLILESSEIIKEKKLDGNILIVHSGGVLSLERVW